MNTRFLVAAHAAIVLALRGSEGATSELIASSAGTHPVVVRRLLSALRNAGLVETRRGPGGGARLARPADEINLCDIWDAIEPEEMALFRVDKLSPNPKCSVGACMCSVLNEALAPSVEAMRASLAQTTLADAAKLVEMR